LISGYPSQIICFVDIFFEKKKKIEDRIKYRKPVPVLNAQKGRRLWVAGE